MPDYGIIEDIRAAYKKSKHCIIFTDLESDDVVCIEALASTLKGKKILAIVGEGNKK